MNKHDQIKILSSVNGNKYKYAKKNTKKNKNIKQFHNKN